MPYVRTCVECIIVGIAGTPHTDGLLGCYVTVSAWWGHPYSPLSFHPVLFSALIEMVIFEKRKKNTKCVCRHRLKFYQQVYSLLLVIPDFLSLHQTVPKNHFQGNLLNSPFLRSPSNTQQSRAMNWSHCASLELLTDTRKHKYKIEDNRVWILYNGYLLLSVYLCNCLCQC